MAIDLYASCPCGSGQKIKFCCRNLAPEIEKVHKMVEGGQRHACLAYVNGLLVKHPAHPFLSVVKSMSLREMNRLDEAEQFVSGLGSLVETHSNISAEDTLIQLAQGADLVDVYDRLQRTLECCGAEVSESVIEALAAVGAEAVNQDDTLPGIRYLTMYQELMPDDREMKTIMGNLFHSRSVSPFIKQGMPLRPLPTELDENEAAQQIDKEMGWGRTRRVLEISQSVAQRHPDHPAAVWNVASCAAYLGKKELLSETLQRYSSLDATSEDDAVHAEVLRQLIAVGGDPVDEMQAVWNVADTDRLIERLQSDPRCRSGQVPPPDENDSRARSAFIWHDREMPEDREDLNWGELPIEVAEVLVFGRETDREPRLVVHGLHDPEWEPAIEQISQVGGDALGSKESEEVVSTLTRPAEYIPLSRPHPRMSNQRSQKLQLAYARQQMQDWPTKRSIAYGDTTLAEAAADPQLRIRAMAFMLRCEIDVALAEDDTLFADLRATLGLPVPGPIDPEGLDMLELSIERFHRLEVEKLTPEQLQNATVRVLQNEYSSAVRPVIREAIRRYEETPLPRLDFLYSKLAAHESDPELARELLEKAQAAAIELKVSCSIWDIQLVYNRMFLEDHEGTERAMRHLIQEHGEEPEVQEFMAKMMQYAGAQRGPAGTAAAPAETPADQPAGLWVPGQENPPAAQPTSPESGAGSKLWIPD